jgi:hypothetical protein
MVLQQTGANIILNESCVIDLSRELVSICIISFIITSYLVLLISIRRFDVIKIKL